VADFGCRKIYVKAETITLCLARKNKNQKWLAEKLGIDEYYLSQIMTKKRNASPFVRERIMIVIKGVEWDELFFFSGTNETN
jgi:hypothetical protein